MQRVYVERSGGHYVTWMYQDGKTIWLKTAQKISKIIAWAKKEGFKLIQVIE